MIGWKVIPRIGIGPVQFSPHGVGIAIGCFVGAWLMARRARARGFDENHAWNTAAWGVVGAIIGARLAYVVGHLDAYSSPVQWLEIWKGGISLIGGLIGGTIFASFYFRRHHLDFWELADLGAPGLALGIAVGRSGDLVIGDHLGKPTHFFLGWVYRGGTLISPPPCLTPSGHHVYPTSSGCIVPGIQVHQTALYDAIWSLCIFGILLLLERRPHRKGLLFLSWAGLYTTGRIVTDFLRVDKRWVFGLTGSQITSIFVVLLCAFLIARYRGAPGAEGPRASHAVGAPHSPDPEPKTSRAAPPGKAAPSGDPVSEEVGKPDSS
jgi:phosphatidylglycerol:prolipoprotein diacylglycerol transferase